MAHFQNGSGPSSGLEGWIEWLRRPEQSDLRICMAGDLNAFMQTLALLGNKSFAKPEDFDQLLARWQITAMAARPALRSRSTSEAQEAARHGTEAVAGALLPETGRNI